MCLYLSCMVHDTSSNQKLQVLSALAAEIAGGAGLSVNGAPRNCWRFRVLIGFLLSIIDDKP